MSSINTQSGSGSGTATCASSPQLLCLAGRTGNTNNPLLSLDAPGVVFGSAARKFGLGLQAVVGANLGEDDDIRLNPFTTTIDGADVVASKFARLLSFGQDLTFDCSVTPAILSVLEVGAHFGLGNGPATWTIHGTNGTYPGILALTGVAFRPILTTDVNTTQHLGFWNALAFEPTLTAADGATFIAGDQDAGLLVTYAAPRLAVGTAASLTVQRVGATVFDLGDIPTGARVIESIGFTHSSPGNTGGVLDVDVGYDVSDPGSGNPHLVAGSVYASLRSTQIERWLPHAGPARFGANAIPDTMLHVSHSSAYKAALTMDIESTNPADPTSNSQMRIYLKSGTPNKIVIQYNDGGTVRYIVGDPTQAPGAFAWSTSTTPP